MSGDSGDWDDADKNEMTNPKIPQQSNKIPQSTSTTRNTSDFMYTNHNHAWDDHEMIHNKNRLRNKIRRVTKKECLVSVLSLYLTAASIHYDIYVYILFKLDNKRICPIL